MTQEHDATPPGRRRQLLKLALAAAAAAPAARVATAAAAGYPARQITIVSAYAPGGLNDMCARAVAKALQEAFGKPAIVENRPGGNTLIGLDYVAHTRPDGQYLITVTDTNMVYFPASGMKPETFDFDRDFTPVTLLCDVPTMLVARQGLDVRTVADVVALSNKTPGGLTFASAGIGSIAHMAGELFKRQAGATLVHVPYKGAILGLTDVMGGQVDVMFVDLGTVAPFVKSGKLTPVAVTSLTRSRVYPDLPTVDEAGVKGFEARLWIGIAARGGTQAEIVAQLNREIVAAMARPEISGAIAATGAELVTDTPEEFAALIVKDRARFAPIIKAANIKFN